MQPQVKGRIAAAGKELFERVSKFAEHLRCSVVWAEAVPDDYQLLRFRQHVPGASICVADELSPQASALVRQRRDHPLLDVLLCQVDGPAKRHEQVAETISVENEPRFVQRMNFNHHRAPFLGRVEVNALFVHEEASVQVED